MNLHTRTREGRSSGPFLASLSLALLSALGAGCTKNEARPPKAPNQAANPSAGQSAALDQPASRQDRITPTSGSVQIEDKIIKACGDIPTAHFAFDSSRIAPDAALSLEALARCFVSGPLKGKAMRLVGHADPRGETEYNVALGQRRAGSVGGFLVGEGMDKAKIQTLSKGSFEATGTDEEGWARDRRVDVFLAEQR